VSSFNRDSREVLATAATMRLVQFVFIVALLLKDSSFEHRLHCERVKCRYVQREKSMDSDGLEGIGVGDGIGVSGDDELSEFVDGSHEVVVGIEENYEKNRDEVRSDQNELKSDQNEIKNVDENPQGSLLIKIEPSRQISIKILTPDGEKSSKFEVNLEKADSREQPRVKVHHKNTRKSTSSEEKLQKSWKIVTSEPKPAKNDENFNKNHQGRKSKKISHQNYQADLKNHQKIQKIQKSHQMNQKTSQKFCETFISPTTLNDQDLTKLTNCNEIDFTSNDLKTISIHFPATFLSLEVITLDNNSLTILPPNLLVHLTNLRNFSAKHNQITAIDELFFTANDHLTHVDLSHNHLKSIPTRIFINNHRLLFASFHFNACINHTYPTTTMEHLIGLFAVNCGDDRSFFTFITKLVQLSSKLRAIVNEFENETSGVGDDEVAVVVPTDLDVLFTGLFWLLVPIILILLGICVMIFYVIYNKFVVYGVSAGAMER
jgi:hypothetical protein